MRWISIYPASTCFSCTQGQGGLLEPVIWIFDFYLCIFVQVGAKHFWSRRILCQSHLICDVKRSSPFFHITVWVTKEEAESEWEWPLGVQRLFLRSLASGIIGHQDNFIVSSGCRWSSDLAEPHQPGGRDLQRGSGGHTEQPRGGAAHYLTAKRCSVCVRVCFFAALYTESKPCLCFVGNFGLFFWCVCFFRYYCCLNYCCVILTVFVEL